MSLPIPNGGPPGAKPVEVSDVILQQKNRLESLKRETAEAEAKIAELMRLETLKKEADEADKKLEAMFAKLNIKPPPAPAAAAAPAVEKAQAVAQEVIIVKPPEADVKAGVKVPNPNPGPSPIPAPAPMPAPAPVPAPEVEADVKENPEVVAIIKLLRQSKLSGDEVLPLLRNLLKKNGNDIALLFQKVKKTEGKSVGSESVVDVIKEKFPYVDFTGFVSNLIGSKIEAEGKEGDADQKYEWNIPQISKLKAILKKYKGTTFCSPEFKHMNHKFRFILENVGIGVIFRVECTSTELVTFGIQHIWPNGFCMPGRPIDNQVTYGVFEKFLMDDELSWGCIEQDQFQMGICFQDYEEVDPIFFTEVDEVEWKKEADEKGVSAQGNSHRWVIENARDVLGTMERDPKFIFPGDEMSHLDHKFKMSLERIDAINSRIIFACTTAEAISFSIAIRINDVPYQGMSWLRKFKNNAFEILLNTRDDIASHIRRDGTFTMGFDVVGIHYDKPTISRLGEVRSEIGSLRWTIPNMRAIVPRLEAKPGYIAYSSYDTIGHFDGSRFGIRSIDGFIDIILFTPFTEELLPHIKILGPRDPGKWVTGRIGQVGSDGKRIVDEYTVNWLFQDKWNLIVRYTKEDFLQSLNTDGSFSLTAMYPPHSKFNHRNWRRNG